MNTLCVLYNIIPKTQPFPSIWKLTNVYSSVKSGGSSKIENCRHITAVCLPAKVLQRILYNLVFSRAESYISGDQHGCFSRRFAATDLIDFVQNVF
jgi:hypothetical protein